MDERLVKLLTRAGAEVCKFLASWFVTPDFTQKGLVYLGMTVVQILLSVFMGVVPSFGTAAKKQSTVRKFAGRL